MNAIVRAVEGEGREAEGMREFLAVVRGVVGGDVAMDEAR